MRSFGAIVATVLLAACSATQDVPLVGKAVDQFHAELNAHRADIIYDESTGAMKSTARRVDFVLFLLTMQHKLGNYRSGKMTGWREFYGTNGHALSVWYASRFEHADAIEQFTYQLVNGEAVLNGYHINSNALARN